MSFKTKGILGSLYPLEYMLCPAYNNALAVKLKPRPLKGQLQVSYTRYQLDENADISSVNKFIRLRNVQTKCSS